MIGEWNNGTGRRKSSVARVFLKKGTGKITVNDKDIQVFFGRQTSIMICRQPLFLTNHVETFDIMINVHGGGESGQAGAVRHGITRALIDYDATLKPALKRSVSARRAAASSSASVNFRFFCFAKSRLVRLAAFFMVSLSRQDTQAIWLIDLLYYLQIVFD